MLDRIHYMPHTYIVLFYVNVSFSHYFRIKIDLLNQEYIVFYVGTNLGHVYKIVQFYRNNEPNSKLLDIFEVATDEPIQVMEISQTRKSLYVGTDNRIKQIDLAMCNRRYDSCFRCVKDPYCGWDKDTNVCRPYELGLLQVTECHCKITRNKHGGLDAVRLCQLPVFLLQTMRRAA